jgi:hypothetical protein
MRNMQIYKNWKKPLCSVASISCGSGFGYEPIIEAALSSVAPSPALAPALN